MFKSSAILRVKFFYIVLILLIFPSLNSCIKKSKDLKPERIVWDRDICTRCLMAISDRKYAAEIIDPHSGKVYKFDDIGCAILWLEWQKPKWYEKAVFYVIDKQTGKWINAKEAFYTTDDLTPMGFGFGALSKKAEKTIDFKEMRRRVITGETIQKKYFKLLEKGLKGDKKK